MGKEIEGLQLKKLKHDIEDNMNINNGKKLVVQYDIFIEKVPKRHRKKFKELKNDENISYDKIHLLLTKILETNYNRNKSIDLNNEKLLKLLSRQSTSFGNNKGVNTLTPQLSNEP